MKQVETILQRLEPAPRIAVVEPTDLDLAEKEDAADYISQFKTVHEDKAQIQSEILEALNTAKPKGIAAGVGELIEDTRSRALDCINNLDLLLFNVNVAIVFHYMVAFRNFNAVICFAN